MSADQKITRSKTGSDTEFQSLDDKNKPISESQSQSAQELQNFITNIDKLITDKHKITQKNSTEEINKIYKAILGKYREYLIEEHIKLVEIQNNSNTKISELETEKAKWLTKTLDSPSEPIVDEFLLKLDQSLTTHSKVQEIKNSNEQVSIYRNVIQVLNNQKGTHLEKIKEFEEQKANFESELKTLRFERSTLEEQNKLQSKSISALKATVETFSSQRLDNIYTGPSKNLELSKKSGHEITKTDCCSRAFNRNIFNCGEYSEC